MNEEYLWDKTGGDAEIEGLENALRALSYKQTAPPELPAKTFVLAETSRRSFFRFGFGLAFAALVVAAVSTVWFLMPSKNIVVSGDQENLAAKPAVIPQANIPAAPEIVLPAQKDVPSAVSVRHVIRTTPKRIDPAAVKPKTSDPKASLTAEEKYAYGQLMLALSITGSKLKIVKDAVGGNENLKTSLDKGKDLYQK